MSELPSIGAYQLTPHGSQIKVLAPGVDARVFDICGCANEFGRRCYCPHNRSVGPCEECAESAPPHHFRWCPLFEAEDAPKEEA